MSKITFLIFITFAFTESSMAQLSGKVTNASKSAVSIGPAPGFIIFNPQKEYIQHYTKDSLSSFQCYIRFQLAWYPHGGELIGKVLAHIPDTVFKIAWGQKTWDSLYNGN